MSLAIFSDNHAPLPMRPGHRIRREVCEKHGISIALVMGPRRFAPIVKCRTEIAGRLADETKLSTPQIGAMLGKDHSTIIMAIRRWNEATGQNIREMGHIPEKTRIRNRVAAAARRPKRTRTEKLKRSRSGKSWSDFVNKQVAG